MTIRITDNFQVVVVEDGAEVVLLNAGLAVPEPDPETKQRLEELAKDPKHPFVVVYQGKPVARSGKQLPERVQAAVAKGAKPADFQIVDLRDGAVYSVKGSK